MGSAYSPFFRRQAVYSSGGRQCTPFLQEAGSALLFFRRQAVHFFSSGGR